MLRMRLRFLPGEPRRTIFDATLFVICAFLLIWLYIGTHLARMRQVSYPEAILGCLFPFIAFVQYISGNYLNEQTFFWATFIPVFLLTPLFWLILRRNRDYSTAFNEAWRFIRFNFVAALLVMTVAHLWSRVPELLSTLGILTAFVPRGCDIPMPFDPAWWVIKPEAIAALGTVFPFVIFAPQVLFLGPPERAESYDVRWSMIFGGVVVVLIGSFGIWGFGGSGWGQRFLSTNGVGPFALFIVFLAYPALNLAAFWVVRRADPKGAWRTASHALSQTLALGVASLGPALLYHSLGCGSAQHWGLIGWQAGTGSLTGLSISWWESWLAKHPISVPTATEVREPH